MPSLDLKIDTTALDDTPDESVVEPVNGDAEEMEVDADADEINEPIWT